MSTSQPGSARTGLVMSGSTMRDKLPGADRRSPRLASPTYAVRGPLAVWLRAEAEDGARRHGRYRVLDIGCGSMPYRPFFAPNSDTYVGVDLVGNPRADIIGSVEALPVASSSFEVVLCTQVLEHCEDPATAVREIQRVVAPGGRVLASTHGVHFYHPSPHDRWRWTHEGLERLFRENADWRSLSITPASGTSPCLAMLVSVYIDLLLKRARVRALGRPLIAALNWTAAAADARIRGLRELRPGALIANYHIKAEP